MMKRENAILAVWMGIFALPFLGNGNLWVAETAAVASAKAAEAKAPKVENVIRGSIELAPALAESCSWQLDLRRRASSERPYASRGSKASDARDLSNVI